MPEYKNVATVEIEAGFKEFEWPEDEQELSGTWWVDKDDNLGILRHVRGSLYLFYVDRDLHYLQESQLQKQVINDEAYPVAVHIKARRVEP